MTIKYNFQQKRTEKQTSRIQQNKLTLTLWIDGKLAQFLISPNHFFFYAAEMRQHQYPGRGRKYPRIFIF